MIQEGKVVDEITGDRLTANALNRSFRLESIKVGNEGVTDA